MSSKKQLPETAAADHDATGVPIARAPQAESAPGGNGASAAHHWMRNSAIGLVIGAAVFGIYFGVQALLREPGAPPSARSARLLPEPTDATAGQEAAAADHARHVPLEPLRPASGGQLIAEAERVARDLVERFPENPDAHEMLARFHFEFADLDEAARAWQRCLQLNASYTYAHAGLGKLAAERGELTQAVEHWRRAILADPGNPGHQIELGKSLLAAGDVAEAIVALEGAAHAAPDSATAHAELGSARLQRREEAAAKAAFERALELDASLPAAHFGLATVCSRLGQLDEARQHEARYREVRDSRKEAVSRTRIAYDDDEALSEDVARLYTDIGSVYLAADQSEQAEQLWRRAARMHAANRACREALAWLMLQQGKPLESIVLLRELARLEPQNLTYPVEVARLLADLGRIDDGLLVLQEFVEAAPDSAAGQTALAEYFLRVKKDPGSAVVHARKAAELSGLAADWALLSSAHERNHDIPAAIAALARATDLSPENLQYRQNLGLLKERTQQTTQQPASGSPRRMGSEPQAPPAAGAPFDPATPRP